MTRNESIEKYVIPAIEIMWNDRTCDKIMRTLEQEPCEDWYDVPSYEMSLEQARQAVKDLRKKLAEYLKQQPCEDAISRQAVLYGLASIAKAKARSDAQKSLMGRVMFFVEHLSSVTPQPCEDVIKVAERSLCDSCTNIGCEFQSGIVRTKCAFYMPSHIESDNCGNYVVMQQTAEAPKMGR